MLDDLVRRVRREDRVDLMVPATLVDVVVADDGEVAGVVVETPNGREEIPCRAVLLATNGFGADDATSCATHLPAIAGAVYHGSDGLARRRAADRGAARRRHRLPRRLPGPRRPGRPRRPRWPAGRP